MCYYHSTISLGLNTDTPFKVHQKMVVFVHPNLVRPELFARARVPISECFAQARGKNYNLLYNLLYMILLISQNKRGKVLLPAACCASSSQCACNFRNRRLPLKSIEWKDHVFCLVDRFQRENQRAY